MKHHHLKSARHVANLPANRSDFLNGTPREHVFQDTPAQLDLHTGWLRHVSYTKLGNFRFGWRLWMQFADDFVTLGSPTGQAFLFWRFQCSSHLACALIGFSTDMQAHSQSQNQSYLHSSAAKLDKITHTRPTHMSGCLASPTQSRIRFPWNEQIQEVDVPNTAACAKHGPPTGFQHSANPMVVRYLWNIMHQWFLMFSHHSRTNQKKILVHRGTLEKMNRMTWTNESIIDWLNAWMGEWLGGSMGGFNNLR